MDAFKLSMLAGAVMLPIFVSFGWKLVRKLMGYNHAHHVLSVSHEPDIVTYDMPQNGDVEDIVSDFDEQLKPSYTDDFYC